MVSFFISTAAFLNFNTAVLLFYNKHLYSQKNKFLTAFFITKQKLTRKNLIHFSANLSVEIIIIISTLFVLFKGINF